MKPHHFAVANAIGAAIAQVGGEVDKVVALEGTSALRRSRRPRQRPSRRRSQPAPTETSVRVVDVEDVPIAYLAGDATRIRVKAIGDLDLGRMDVAAGG